MKLKEKVKKLQKNIDKKYSEHINYKNVRKFQDKDGNNFIGILSKYEEISWSFKEEKTVDYIMGILDHDLSDLGIKTNEQDLKNIIIKQMKPVVIEEIKKMKEVLSDKIIIQKKMILGLPDLLTKKVVSELEKEIKAEIESENLPCPVIIFEAEEYKTEEKVINE